MNLETITAKIRPRRGWEAIDLGVTLVQNHAKTLYKIWFAISLPLFLVLTLAMNAMPEIMIIVFWWLKPIMERPLLHFLSRELFGESLSAKECIKSFFSVAKIQWLASLTWRRFSFTRSLDLPLIQLEGLKGAQRAKRLRVIHSGDSGTAVWLTIAFILVETIIYLSLITLIYLLVPEIYLEHFDLWKWLTAETESDLMAFLFNFLMYLGISLVAPFYVACGFALYLNQRTHLEAWDIELAFKRLATKLSEKSSNYKVRLASYILPCLLIFNLGIFHSNKLYAEEIEPDEITITKDEGIQEILENTKVEKTISKEAIDLSELDLNNLTHEQTKQVITNIKNGEDFHQKEMQEDYVYRNSTEEEEEPKLQLSSGWLIFVKIMALVVEFALWIFIAVLIIFLLIKYKNLVFKGMPNKKISKKRPEKLFGLELNTESLPEKPWLVAKQLIEEDKYREATSLLYRACIIWYIDNSDAIIKEGYTELECLTQISKYAKSTSQKYLQRLTFNWRALAYAHQVPTKDTLNNLCENWSKNMAVKAVTHLDATTQAAGVENEK